MFVYDVNAYVVKDHYCLRCHYCNITSPIFTKAIYVSFKFAEPFFLPVSLQQKIFSLPTRIQFTPQQQYLLQHLLYLTYIDLVSFTYVKVYV